MAMRPVASPVGSWVVFVCDVLVGEAEIVGAILVEERVVDEIHARHRVQVGVATHLHGKERLFVVLHERGEWIRRAKYKTYN